MDEPLPGGNLNAVVRRGDTVLRLAGPWTPTVHRFLAHLRARGVTEVPIPLGLADDGREVLSFVPGDVPLYPLPDWIWTDGVLQQAAALLRRIHDAGADFDRTGAVWQQPAHESAEVICHNDFAPHNLVFGDGHVTGVIDFDTCSPGPRVWDLAYLAIRVVPLTAGGGTGSADRAELLRRTRLLLESYGTDASVGEVLLVAHRRLLDLADFSRAKSRELDKPELAEHADFYVAEAAWLAAELHAG